ncbi:MAG: VCBS repeat-containing protein [Spartobacteria bacterium]|nr:VCBS repeat-containing protein [Spartobacteria bacterium]
MKHINISIRYLTLVSIISVLCAARAGGALSGPPGSQTAVLYHADNGTLSFGLCVFSNMAYFGRATTLRSYDLDTGADAICGYLPYNVSISIVEVLDSLLHTAFGTSYSWPFPYQLGHIDNTLNFVANHAVKGIYDSAVHPRGDMYLVTNPDPNNYGSGHIGTGTCIHARSPLGTLRQVAVIGGDSGGIAFDSQGNLYYAYQAPYPDPSQIVRFSAAQLEAGNLTINDAQAIVDVAAGYLAFDGQDYLYATVGWGNQVNKYDPETGRLIATVATDSTAGYGIGKWAWCDATKSFINNFTDWFGYQGYLYELIRPYQQGDFDRDGLADSTACTPEGEWLTRLSASGETVRRQWGWSATQPVQGDFDGDAFADLAAYHPQNGMWYIEHSLDGALQSLNWGWDGAMPVSGDFDGDGVSDIAVYGNDGRWYVRHSSDGSEHITAWGWEDARPAPADYDGDHQTDLAVFGNGVWYILLSSDASLLEINWGWPGATPAPGDYDGDGLADIAVYGDHGRWFIRASSDEGLRIVDWGWDDARPVPMDYDGDGLTDPAVQDGRYKQYIRQSRTLTGRVVELNQAVIHEQDPE